MMYGLTMHVNGSMELFNISDSMVEGIIKDINHYNDRQIVVNKENCIAILDENEETIYFYDKNDRKEKAVDFINVH